jgi:hypothetical protein
MSLGSTQSLTEMSTRNLPGSKGGRRVNLEVSQTYGPSRPDTGIALSFVHIPTDLNVFDITYLSYRNIIAIVIFLTDDVISYWSLGKINFYITLRRPAPYSILRIARRSKAKPRFWIASLLISYILLIDSDKGPLLCWMRSVVPFLSPSK